MLAEAVAVVVMACSGGTSTPVAEIVDSAGVRTVTYDLRDATVPTFATVGEHDLQIGVRNGPVEYTFGRVADLEVADDGSIIVSDGSANEIRVYDANGVYARTLGGPGDGPGEFATAPQIAGLSRDTVFAWDSRSRRVTVFSRAGNLVRMTTLRGESMGRPLRAARLDDGTYLMQSRWVAPDVDDTEVHGLRVDLDSVAIEHVDASGTLIDTIRVLADTEHAGFSEDVGGGRLRTLEMQLPLSARAFMRSDGVRPIIGHGDVFELVWYGRDGVPTTTLRVDGAWPVMSAGEIRTRMEEAVRDAMGGGELDPMMRRVYGELLPERTPVLANVVVGSDDDVWVRRYDFATQEWADWLVFSPDGELRGRLRTPPGLRVYQVRPEFIVGVARDDLDVEYVRRYPLSRSRDE